MKENAFMDKGSMPDENRMIEALGNCYPFYLKLMDLAKGFETKWTFYKGWSLKVFKKSKALFYLVPYSSFFTVNMAIRESERENMLGDADLAPFRQALIDAKKYNEGYAVIIEVSDNNSFNLCYDFVSKLILFR
ncbi:MAG: DUF3788 family protein [Eubacteriales bacterium]